MIPLDLPPTEYKTADVLLRAANGGNPRLRTVEIAEMVGITIRHAQRVLVALIKRGLALCTTRGVYQTAMTPTATSTSPNWYVYKPNDQEALATEAASQPLVGAAPEMSESRGRPPMRAYDDGDDLAGVGLTEPKAAKTSRPKRRVPAGHRDIPRERWTMEYVAKEFRKQCSDLNPITIATWRERTIISPTGGNEMAMVLKAWQAQYGITPQEAAAILDEFFADPRETDQIDSSVPAYKRYLQYLKTHVDDLRKRDVTGHLVDLVDSQVIAWD